MQRNTRKTNMYQHAIKLFDRLGYTLIDGSQEESGTCAATGRQRDSDVVLRPRLRQVLCELNPDITDKVIDEALAQLVDDRSLSTPERANQDVYKLLKDGIKINVHSNQDESTSEQVYKDTHKTVHIIDWENPKRNDFTLVSHFWVNGKLGKKCLDLAGFVNGLPFILLGIEDGELQNIYDRIDKDYKQNIPTLFWYNAFIVVSNNFTCKLGSITSPWEFFFQWKRVKDECEDESTSLDTLVQGTCDKVRLLDIVENFTLFDSKGGLKKLIARNHQYLGVNNAIAVLCNREVDQQEKHRKLGVFWHTQGSGKSYSMIFFVCKVLHKISNDYRFVVVTDREDLDQQIYENFHDVGAIIEDPKDVHAQKCEHLKRLLSETHFVVFTLIQKFRTENPGQDNEKLSDSNKIIVIVDEAHRTQYDTLAKNIRDALPKAAFIGFTGTPLMDGEEQTRQTFGNYVSIYNFRRAINDGVTVPLYYENRTPEIDLSNQNFGEEMAELLANASLDPQQEQKVLDIYARANQFLNKDERLEWIADDIVNHFMNRGYMGKAMVVSSDKIAAVRIHDRVQKYWRFYQDQLHAQLAQEQDPDARLELSDKIAYMEQTRMAVVVSDSEDDDKRFAEFEEENNERIDISIHHQRFREEKLAEHFKDAKHPLRIAFVCSMWMTGFDIPCLSTIYLNRKLESHTLMQTIARANRVFKEKTNGLIVDYASTIHALEEALAIYAREDTSGQDEGDRPVGNKSELVQALRDKLAEIEAFCQGQSIDVQMLQADLRAEADKELQQESVKPAIDRLVAYDEIKLNYLILAAEVRRLYKAILPDAAEKDFTLPVYLYRLIEQGIYATMHTLGIDSVLSDVTKLVRNSITLVRERVDRLSTDTYEELGTFDMSQIDINALDVSLHNGYRHIKAEQLRNLLFHKIRRMIQANKTRIDYQKKLQRAVDRYNEGCENQVTYPMLVDPKDKITLHPATREAQEQLLDELDNALVELVRDVTQEEQRHAKEGLSEEELVLFDILMLDVSLSQQEREEVKQVVRQLLDSLSTKFALEWYKKAQTLNQVQVTISTELDKLPQVYTSGIYNQKCSEVFLHVQEYYRNDGTISAAG